MSVVLSRPVAALLALVFSLSIFVPAVAYPIDEPLDFADPAFLARGERTERPVDEGRVDRTWMWGPGPFTAGLMEAYSDSPGGERLVQYFDKARMEINHPENDPNELWYVTNGLLVVEMIDGKFQIGDDEFDWSPAPADIPIAGDLHDLFGPTYADIHDLGLRGMDATPEGVLIQQTIVNGEIHEDPHYAQYGVTGGHRVQVPGIDHTVADVFWDFMNSEGLVAQDGEFVEDRLFINPFYATGYPITEAYWQNVLVGDVETDVLWQCFERRCLTFTPDNDPGWQVEAGNVGLHYHEWRYHIHAPETEVVLLYLVDDEDPDAGIPFGVPWASLVPVEIEIPRHDAIEDRIAATLQELFVYEHEHLLNEWIVSETNVSIESISMTGRLATINLTGEIIPVGGPSPEYLEAQLAHTAMQFDEVDQAIGLLNGGPFTEQLETPIEGIVAVFDVDGEQFRVWITNEETISDVEALEAGQLEGYFPSGVLDRGRGEANHNHPWSWHLDPEQTELVDSAFEDCDQLPSRVEAHVDAYVDNVGLYCPSQAELVRIIDYRDSF
jgi:hypothetical protein